MTSKPSSSPTSVARAALGEVPALAASVGLRSPSEVARSSPSRPACGVSSQTRPPRDRAQAAGPGGRDRHRHHPLVDRLGVDQHRLRRGVAVTPPLPPLAAALAVVGGRPPGRLRVERRRRGRPERHQVRPGAAEEGQVEDPVVVDRVEGAGGQEGQVQPVEGEHRVGVDEPQRGDLHRRRVVAVGDPAGEDLAQALRARVRPGQPGRVRRPGQPGRVARARSGRPPGPRRRPRRRPAPGRRARRPPAGCRPGTAASSSTRPSRPAPNRRGRRAAVGRRDLDRVVAVGVGDPGDLRHRVLRGRGRAEHLRQPGPYARGVGQRRGRAVPGGQPVHGAAHLDRAGPAGAVGRDVAELVAGAERARPPAGARAGQVDLERPRLRVAVRRAATGRRHAARPAGCRRCAAPARTHRRGRCAGAGRCRRGSRVDVAPALVVGEEGDPVADPVRVLQLRRVVAEQPLELAAAVPVDPQLAGRAAAVALPGRAGPPLVGAEHDRAAGAGGDHVARPVRQALGRRPPSSGSAQDQTRLRNGSPAEVLATTRPSGSQPATRVCGVAPVRQPGGRAAVHRHRVHLRARRRGCWCRRPSRRPGDSRAPATGTSSAVSRHARPPAASVSQTSSSATKAIRSPRMLGKRR